MTNRCTSESLAGYRCELENWHKCLHRAHGVTFGGTTDDDVDKTDLCEGKDMDGVADFNCEGKDDKLGEFMDGVADFNVAMPIVLANAYGAATRQLRYERRYRKELRDEVTAMTKDRDEWKASAEAHKSANSVLIRERKEAQDECDERNKDLVEVTAFREKLASERLEVMHLCFARLEPRLCSDSVVQRVTALCARITAMQEECDDLRDGRDANDSYVSAALGLVGRTTQSQRVKRAKELVIEGDEAAACIRRFSDERSAAKNDLEAMTKERDESKIERDKLYDKLKKIESAIGAPTNGGNEGIVYWAEELAAKEAYNAEKWMEWNKLAGERYEALQAMTAERDKLKSELEGLATDRKALMDAVNSARTLLSGWGPF